MSRAGSERIRTCGSTYDLAAMPIPLAVVGAHLTGQPLHHQLTERDARLVTTTTTDRAYRLYALHTEPPKPGLRRVTDGSGAAIEVEVWEMDAAHFGTFVAAVPPPLAIGTITLADGSEVPGFVCEPHALEGADEITTYGGWRSYLASRP
jgi:allophanate hydrolase